MPRIKVDQLYIENTDDGQAVLLCETEEGDYRIAPTVKLEERILSTLATSFTKVDRPKEQTKEEE